MGTVHELYMYTAEVGDIVRLPNGYFGKVVFAGFVDGGHNIKVCVDPYVGWFKKLRMRILGELCFFNERINSLKRMPNNIKF